MREIKLPLSVPKNKKTAYRRHYGQLTNDSGRLFLIAGDQKIEHLNADFYGPGISAEDNRPEHLFQVAAAIQGAVFAAHLGLISRYGDNYRQITYLVKINGRTNLGDNETKKAAKTLWSVEDVVRFKKESGLKIVGIGYTLYLGGPDEAKMISQAARAVFEAHQNGLVAVLWVYPRGKNVKEEDIQTIAGGAGVAASLDADFVKVKYPYAAKDKKAAAIRFKTVVEAAGRTGVICVGGAKRSVKDLLADTDRQMKISGAKGLAMGRNLHQRSLADAGRLTRALSAIIFGAKSAREAELIYNQKTAAKPKRTGRFLGLF